MTDHNHNVDEALERAIARLPEAPPDPSFAARVLARAAVTPQCAAVAGRAVELRPGFKFAWALTGFSLGVAIFVLAYVSMLSVMVNEAGASEPRPALSQSVMVFDPLEAAMMREWNGGEAE